MGQKETVANFLAAVEQSFLPERDKDLLRRAAAKGVSAELWNQLNDMLIAAVVASRSEATRQTRRLDAEIDRFTGEYEKEKTVLDLEFRTELEQADDSAKERMWAGYARRIRALQSRFLGQVKRTSTTILRDVVLATVPISQEEMEKD